MTIRINKSTDSGSWYANRIGEIHRVEWFERNRSPAQGIPEDVYWCREGGRYNPVNWIRASDVMVVEGDEP